MAKNKNAIIRYRVLDRCFGNPGRNYTVSDLVNECNNALQDDNPSTGGVCRRTIFEDIRFMESAQGWSVPLLRIKNGKTTYYRYSDSNFSISNSPLNETEINQLKEALSVFSRIKGMPQFEWVDVIIARLKQQLSISDGLPEVIRFDSNIYLKGIEYLAELYNAIIYKKVLKMSYQPFDEPEPGNFNFHPYFLNEYNNRWFVFGYGDKHKRVITLALDRIKCFSEADKKYVEYTGTFFSEMLEDIIGVSLPDNVPLQKFKLWFSPQRAPYIITKPLHGSMKVVSNNETGLIVTIEVIPNKELSSLIYSFGKDVELLEGELQG